jgi:hypothetical protein
MTATSFKDFKSFGDLSFGKEILTDYFIASRNNKLNYKFGISFNKEVEAMKRSGCSFN